MGKLIYTVITSLDGCLEDAHGNFGVLAPDVDVADFVNELERPVRTHLLGRRMYEVMTYWETHPAEGEGDKSEREFAEIWRGAEKIVFSRTLHTPSSARTRIEREFTGEAIRQLKADSPTDISLGGAELAGHAIAEGVVDECRLLVAPIFVGGGKPAVPVSAHTQMELVDEHRFRSGFVYLRYRFH